MKLRHEPLPDGGVRAALAGDLEVASCTCLENFWELRLAPARRLEVDLSGLETLEAEGLAVLAGLVAEQLDKGAQVRLEAAPEGVRAALDVVGLRPGEGRAAALTVAG